MANKAIFSYGNGGKRKIGHSKFDMGHEHIMSSNFGGLLPAACFETLPDDYWDISDNTVTLLKPMTAPAFTRINQNFYGAYVRNQQIWKYWNDYISNGTAYGDVYGNNVTNQSLQNAWDIPSIPTPYLQSILKIGFGNATPVFYHRFRFKDGDPTSNHLAGFIRKNITWHNDTIPSAVYRITDAVYALLQVDPLNSSLVYPEVALLARDIDLTRYAFDVYMVKEGDEYYFLFSLYCSLRQYLAFLSSMEENSVQSVTPDVFSPSSTVGNNVSDNHVGNADYKFCWRFFADSVSSNPSTSQSAFLIEKSTYLGTDSKPLKSLDYYPRIISSEVSKVQSLHFVGGYRFTEVWQSIHSPYFGMRYCCFCNSATSIYRIFPANYATPNFDPSTNFYWELDASQMFGVSTDFSSLMESWSENISYTGVSTTSYLNSFENFGVSSQSITVSYNTTQPSQFMSGFGEVLNGLVLYPFRVVSSCDLVLPVLVVNQSGSIANYAPQSSFCSRESSALGYDALSCIAYLCNNASMLLDTFGIKVDPLSQRPFADYRFELTNSLPFFAYSKVWNDNFRNSVVSSPELDFSESNGPIYAPSNFYSLFVFLSYFREPAVRPSRYVGKVASDFDANGWTLEMTTLPRNSQGSKIHTHLPIKSFSDVFSVLTGSCFDLMFRNLTNTDLNVFDFYMPTYYNGLLHLKYQNFNKDYFTSALLDPMSGANQVTLGSTVNELRQAEAEQHWWERTAMYRSVKSWFQGTYGITPIELPEDSRITGSDHIDVQIGEVIQTSGSTPESPQGTRTGLGGARGSGSLCHGHCNEHGWILILVSHTVESQYTQSYDKMWDVKESFLDYPTIDFASIGNESILQKELNYTTVATNLYDYNYYAISGAISPIMRYLPCDRSSSLSYRGVTNPVRMISLGSGKYNISQNAGTSLDNIFGFIPRYSSYKFKFDQVSGQFRNELKFWHTFKRYLTSPILCHEFVNWEMAADDDDINRIFAVSDDFLDDKFAIDCFINASVDRALPFVCVPMSK